MRTTFRFRCWWLMGVDREGRAKMRSRKVGKKISLKKGKEKGTAPKLTTKTKHGSGSRGDSLFCRIFLDSSIDQVFIFFSHASVVFLVYPSYPVAYNVMAVKFCAFHCPLCNFCSSRPSCFISGSHVKSRIHVIVL